MIITLGEGIIGTVASINAVVHGPEGWTVDAARRRVRRRRAHLRDVVDVLRDPVGARCCTLHRERSFVWGYGHIVIFGALAAIGAGLHVAAYYLEHETTLGPTGTVLSTAIPVAIYVLALYVIYAAFIRHARPVPPPAPRGDGRGARALGRPRGARASASASASSCSCSRRS